MGLPARVRFADVRLSRGALLAGFAGLLILLLFSVVGFPGSQTPDAGPLAERAVTGGILSSPGHGVDDVVQWGLWLSPNASDEPVTLDRVELGDSDGVTLLDARVAAVGDDGGIELRDGEPDPVLAPVEGFELPGSAGEDDGLQWQLVLVLRVDGPAGVIDSVVVHYRQARQEFAARYDEHRLELGAATTDSTP